MSAFEIRSEIQSVGRLVIRVIKFWQGDSGVGATSCSSSKTMHRSKLFRAKKTKMIMDKAATKTTTEMRCRAYEMNTLP